MKSFNELMEMDVTELKQMYYDMTGMWLHELVSKSNAAALVWEAQSVRAELLDEEGGEEE